MAKVFKKAYKIFWKIFVLPFVNRSYVRMPAVFEKIFSTDPKKTFVFVTAFNEPELIALHHGAAQKNLGDGCEYFIIDNSTMDDRSAAIGKYCLSHEVNYVRLPQNPGLDGSLHHGLALNWVYRNIVQKFKPWAFGFMDSDLFPIRPVDIPGRLKAGDTWGIVNCYRPVFFLWAGLSFFRLERFAKKTANFLPTWRICGGKILTFDTGGRIRVGAKTAEKLHDLFSAPIIEVRPGVVLHDYGEFVHFQGSFIEPEESLIQKKIWLAHVLSHGTMEPRPGDEYHEATLIAPDNCFYCNEPEGSRYRKHPPVIYLLKP